MRLGSTIGGVVGGVAGGVGGFYAGGPIGAVAGATAGYSVGSQLGGKADKSSGLFNTGILGTSKGYEPSTAPYPAPVYTSLISKSGAANLNDPTYKPSLSTFTESLPPEYTMQNPYATGTNYLTQLDEERKSLANLTNPWVGLMRQQVGSDYSANLDKAKTNIAGQIQQSMETLASRGGARTGARETLAGMGQGEMFKSIQQLGRQKADQLRGIDTKAYETSLGILEKLPSLQAQQYGIESNVQQQNIANMIKERQYAFDTQMQAYNTQMQTWAAQQQAQATAAAAKPGLIGQIFGGVF